MARSSIDRDRLPLTAEGLDEEAAFDAAQAKTGGQIRRIASGYVQTEPGVIRHFADYENMRAFVFRGVEPMNSKQPHSRFAQRSGTTAPPSLQNPATHDLTKPWHQLRNIIMTPNNRACKNCTSYTDQHKCTKGKSFLTDIITTDGERVVTSPHRNSVCVQHEMRRGLPKVFYIRPTTCADCFYFSAEPTEFDATESFDSEVIPAGCGFGYEIFISDVSRECRPIQASDQACEEHNTVTEMDIENEKSREIIEREAAEAKAARQSEASAERLTMQLLGKLRKGGVK
jgi:hypothetical protein